jgi:hypothetical protein
MFTNNQTLIFKAQSLYVACAPHAGLCSFGGCFEEAVNGLQDELRNLPRRQAKAKRDERESHAQS